MAESKMIDQWQELVNLAMKTARVKQPFVEPTQLNYHQFLYWCTKSHNK